MRKMMIFVAVFCLLAGGTFAIGPGIGVRSMAMGGTGIAIANDITAAYFNPAGLMYGPENFECQLFAGGATQGISEITDILSSASDSDKLINNLLPKTFNVDASLAAGLGLSVRKVGLSAIVTGNTIFSKPKADKLDLDVRGNVSGFVPLTLGSSFTTPILPLASIAVGVNLKSLYDIGFSTKVTSDTATGIATGSSSVYTGTGFGFDIGAMVKLTPLISVGGVIRNLSASEMIETKTKTLTATLDSDLNAQVVEGDETDTKTSYTPPQEVGVGVGVLIPLTGTLVACDLENYSSPDKGNRNKSESFTDTHIGIEQGLLFNIVMLRLGYYTYSAVEDTFFTWGLGLNMGPASLGLAASNSVKDSNDSVCMAQLGVAF